MWLRGARAVHAGGQGLVDEGYSPLFVARDGEVVGVAALGDPLRDDAKAMVEQLQARGWQVGILSGDHPSVVRSVGASLGFRRKIAAGGCCRGTR